MPSRPLRICSKSGCTELVSHGYCAKHTTIHAAIDRGFHPSKHAGFYSHRAWTEASIQHREHEPLCRRCRAEGIVRVAALVHHHPALEVLLSQGLDPYDDRYLESLCLACHNKELTLKQKKYNNKLTNNSSYLLSRGRGA